MSGDDMNVKLIPVILCGGAGSRLWPVSREQHPKPFIYLPDGETLIEKTFTRAAQLQGVSEIVTVTNHELLFKTVDAYEPINRAGIFTRYILEPEGRNTAAAVASAAMVAYTNHGEDALMLILPADHLIQDQDAFEVAVSKAMVLAGQGRLVTFGMQPDRPETGYGYIESNGSDVVRFVEKPALKDAESFVESGRFLWNSGMFCFTVSTILREMELHCPDILATVKACLAVSAFDKKEGYSRVDLDRTVFRTVPDISFDYAVMEKSENVSVVPCSIGWSDIGSWSAISALTQADEQGNAQVGEALFVNAKNCFVQSEDRFVGVVGVEGVIVIDTPDALLVVHREHAQDVKKIYATLKAGGHEAHKLHRTVSRPWGQYTVLEDSDRFKIKRIEVAPGESLSLQMHYHRSEHWIVVKGSALVVNGDNEIMLSANQSTYIPAGHKHRLTNPGRIPLVMIEVQSGEYLGEDDIKRFEDVYGRVPT